MTDENNKEKDAISGVETTGHEWDGLKELNNPTPRWWLWVFIVTIIWAIGYWVIYPTWPTWTGHTIGKNGWTEYNELRASQAEIETLRGQFMEKIHASTVEQIQQDPKLYEFARAGGAAAFKENCSACHGTGAEGRKGYPNLNDDDWLFGGTLPDIYNTIRVGSRSTSPDTHNTMMPSFGRDGILKPEQIYNIVDYVSKLHKGDKAEKTAAYLGGQKIFADNCSACHGKSGEGDQKMGAPRLSDEIWLYGGDQNSIHDSVSNAHAGVMPSWEGRLSDDTIKELAIYVHSLGGGK
jgi:cytochrome c oxidase cbb3-type subunit 3